MSIFIPVWNGADLIERAIESCLNQTYRNIEVVIIDDASTDNTQAVVQKYAAADQRIKSFRNPENRGFLENYLGAFQSLSGEYCQLLCHDDWLSRNYVEEGIKNFEAHPDALGIVSRNVGLTSGEDGGLVWVGETKFQPGPYPVRFVLQQFFWQNWGTAFFSMFKLQRLNIPQLRIFYAEIFKDPEYGHLYRKGVGSDYFSLLNILKENESSEIISTDRSAYLNLLRPRSTSFFVNSEQGKPLDALRQNQALLRGYLKIMNGTFKRYGFGLKMFVGAGAVNYLLNSVRNRFMPHPAPLSDVSSVRKFLREDYYWCRRGPARNAWRIRTSARCADIP